ncbi:crossover junction endodeoxyribonuclease RuvC [Candidatus Woesebacteria bacterium]|nr:crossover junction endodeoxyribonuclease RuvC [Candidatus Woesebacteria bacterium]|tara:strand:- start:89 stop:649 length:561 start_codon:yes stop_codon:yes gene_type:complete
MLIIGIDPGTATTGYGLVKVQKNGGSRLLASGLIETKNNGNHPKRLNEIYKSTISLLKLHSPDIFAIEKIFFFSNAKTVISVGQAQGVLMLAAARSRVPVTEYAPGQIKKVVGGNGRADKEEMKKAVRREFGIRPKKGKKTHFDNEADAIAVALCHIKLLPQKMTNGGPPSHKASEGKKEVKKNGR